MTRLVLVVTVTLSLTITACSSKFKGYRGITDLPQDALLMAPEDADWNPPAPVGDIGTAGTDEPVELPDNSEVYPPGQRWQRVWIYESLNAAGDVVHGHYVSIVERRDWLEKPVDERMPMQPLQYKEKKDNPAATLVPSDVLNQLQRQREERGR